MKSIFITATYMLVWGAMWGQQAGESHVEGTVTYKSSQNVYVRFANTDAIQVGDTLFFDTPEGLLPAIVVAHKSSISCVGTPLDGVTIDVDDHMVFVRRERPQPEPSDTKDGKQVGAPTDVEGGDPALSPPGEPGRTGEANDEKQAPVRDSEVQPPPVVITDDAEVEEGPEESIRGRLTLSYYANMTNKEGEGHDRHRMRYTFSLNGQNFNGSRFSADAYVSYRHSLNNAETRRPSDESLKLYNAALGYQAGDNTQLWLGRRYNQNIANIGAIDGLQFETAVSKLLVGGFAGTRPDYTDYGFNPDLLQFGAFVSNTTEGEHGVMLNTLSAVEQRNNGVTDRRFAYFQHSNSLVNNLHIFSSFELELFMQENGEPVNTLHMTSIYFSMRYRASRKLSLFASYDARNNVIYYETYKNFIDQLIDEEMRQGFRARINYRPLKYVTVGVNGGYRFQKDNPNESKNLRAYITHSRVPGLNASVSLSAILLQTGYLDGAVYGVRLSRDIVKGKLYGQAEFRMVDYTYVHSDFTLSQKIAGMNLSWRLNKKLSFNVYYEGIFGDTNYSNLHFRTIRRL